MAENDDQTDEKTFAFLGNISTVFDRSYRANGLSPRSVLWRDEDGQKQRFRILCRVLEHEDLPFTINDLGCGYASLFDYLTEDLKLNLSFYYGYDISESLINAAIKRIQSPRAVFYQSSKAQNRADYSIVSGTFNYCHEVGLGDWEAYLEKSLKALWDCSEKGMAVNFLQATEVTQANGLYYTPIGRWETFCRKNLSPNLEVVTDYPLKEWSLILRR